MTGPARTGPARPPSVAVVGGGASGAIAVLHLLPALPAGSVVTVIDPAEQLGRGIAYGRAEPWHLLNVPAGRMSAVAGDPADLLRWLDAEGAPVDAGAFIPRAHYGDYLERRLAACIPAAAAGFEHRRDEAVALGETGQGRLVVTCRRQVVEADHVVVATGHAPPHIPVPVDDAVRAGGRLVADPWAALPPIDTDEPVLIIGTGLTMVDTLLTLRRTGHRGPVTALSRHGRMPLRHATSAQTGRLSWSPPDHARTAHGLLAAVRVGLDTAEREGAPWQAVIDALRPVTPAIWQRLPPAERGRFLRHLRSLWEVHRHRVAPEIAAEIDAEMVAGTLRVERGRLLSVAAAGDRLRVSYAVGGCVAVAEAGLVVCCTGPATDARAWDNPLLAAAISCGRFVPDPLGLGVLAGPEGHPIGIDGMSDPRIHLLGPLLRASRYETTAIPEIRTDADRLARRIAGASCARPAAPGAAAVS